MRFTHKPSDTVQMSLPRSLYVHRPLQTPQTPHSQRSLTAPSAPALLAGTEHGVLLGCNSIQMLASSAGGGDGGQIRCTDPRRHILSLPVTSGALMLCPRGPGQTPSTPSPLLTQH